MCVCVWGAGGCLDKYINAATPPPPKQKFLVPPLVLINSTCKNFCCQIRNVRFEPYLY